MGWRWGACLCCVLEVRWWSLCEPLVGWMGASQCDSGPSGASGSVWKCGPVCGEVGHSLLALNCVQDLALGPCHLDLQELNLC